MLKVSSIPILTISEESLEKTRSNIPFLWFVFKIFIGSVLNTFQTWIQGFGALSPVATIYFNGCIAKQVILNLWPS